MKLGSRHPFLVLQRTEDGKHHKLQIVASRERILRGWTSSTRLSPLVGLSDVPCSSPDDKKFTNLTHIIFLGPLHPEKILPYCSKNTNLWLTLGLFNILFATESKKACIAESVGES
jgi:hypothetical protein